MTSMLPPGFRPSYVGSSPSSGGQPFDIGSLINSYFNRSGGQGLASAPVQAASTPPMVQNQYYGSPFGAYGSRRSFYGGLGSFFGGMRPPSFGGMPSFGGYGMPYGSPYGSPYGGMMGFGGGYGSPYGGYGSPYGGYGNPYSGYGGNASYGGTTGAYGVDYGEGTSSPYGGNTYEPPSTPMPSTGDGSGGPVPFSGPRTYGMPRPQF